MASPPQLPEYLAPMVGQLVELSVRDYDVYGSARLLDDRARALRSHFESSLAAGFAHGGTTPGAIGRAHFSGEAETQIPSSPSTRNPMSSPPRLPKRLARLVDQLVERAVRDADVSASARRLDDCKQALRSHFDASLSAALAERNEDRHRKGSRAMQGDALLAIFDLLPVTGVCKAAQVCSQWRAVAMSHPFMWTHLDVRTTTKDDGGDACHPSVIASNLRLVEELLPRSETHPLTLAVDATSPWSGPSLLFIDALYDLLMLVAPRLSVLRIETACKDVVRDLFDGKRSLDFPILRELVCAVPGPAADGGTVDLSRVLCPMLTRLDVGLAFEVSGLGNQPQLAFLRTRLAALDRLVPLLRETPALQRFEFTTPTTNDFRPVVPAAVRSALSAVDEVCFRTLNDASKAAMDPVHKFLQSLPCTRVELELTPPATQLTFWPVLRGRWAADAAQLALRDAPGALELVFADAQRRTLAIRLFDDKRTQRVDWERIPTLGGLTALRVDASLWRRMMRTRFPSVPLLASTTLVLDGAGGLDAVMPAGNLDACPGLRLLAEAAFEFEPQDRQFEAPPVPPVPSRRSRLILSSNTPVSITKWSVADVKERLLVDRVVLDGVSMRSRFYKAR